MPRRDEHGGHVVLRAQDRADGLALVHQRGTRAARGGGFVVAAGEEALGATPRRTVQPQADVRGDAEAARVRDALAVEHHGVGFGAEEFPGFEDRGGLAEGQQAGDVGEARLRDDAGLLLDGGEVGQAQDDDPGVEGLVVLVEGDVGPGDGAQAARRGLEGDAIASALRDFCRATASREKGSSRGGAMASLPIPMHTRPRRVSGRDGNFTVGRAWGKLGFPKSMTLSLPRRLRLPAFSGRELRFLKIIANDLKRRVAPAPLSSPDPAAWSDERVTAAWLGHSTVLINFYGVNILTDPVLGSRVGIHVAGPVVLGMKRYVAPALTFRELPPIDLVLLSHAHMDHFDLRTLRRFDRRPLVVTAHATGDFLRGTRLGGRVHELGWGESDAAEVQPHGGALARDGGELEVEAFEVRHWGARMRTDDHRGYNGYVLRRGGRAVLVGGDTSFTTALRQRLRGRGGAAKRRGCSTWRSCPSARTTRGSTAIARPNRPSRWRTWRADGSCCRCITRRSS